MEVDEAIRTMRAVRQFTDQPVPEETIRAIVNAGRRAQSSKNNQAWQFVIVRDRETLKQLAGTGTYAGHLAGAAFAVALVTPNESIYDLGQATAFMMLEAWAHGVGSCIATIYEPDQARAILGVPDGQRLPHAISFGYPAAADAAQAPPKQGGRLPFEDVVRWERW